MHMLFWVCISFSLYSSSVCNDGNTVQSLKYSFEERVGSKCLILEEPADAYVILQLNVTLHDGWTVYTTGYDIDMLGKTPRQALPLSCCWVFENDNTTKDLGSTLFWFYSLDS